MLWVIFSLGDNRWKRSADPGDQSAAEGSHAHPIATGRALNKSPTQLKPLPNPFESHSFSH